MKFFVYYNQQATEIIDDYLYAWHVFRELRAVANRLGGYVALVDGNTCEVIADNAD